MEPASASRILSRDRLIEEVNAARRQDLSVIFANGCFDPLHVGHIRYLEGAKALGNLLVVGLNSDRQVSRLKGSGRPLLPEDQRAEIIASLAAVDFVTIFDEPTVETLLLALRPDVHAKGTDYSLETVPERAVVKSYGGKVAIVGDPKDHSSSDLIQRLR
ncbi:MAG: D-glycero-beta-D-manno-heptose 1-phosphate adenylyltransferase [Blastocatellia bacterium]|jgi:rfaE bifunctional protein nucleotidyltransferase chain/domain|nr:D-glycero-beta-D-manno-heptose 1-phosphate adenylyltransferase [Blastocatellia bacterium]